MTPKLLLPLLLFPVLLSAQSYQKLHHKATVIDTHNDVLSQVVLEGLSIEQDLTGKAQSDLARFRRCGVDVEIFSVFCDERFGKDTAFKLANIQIDSLDAIISRNGDKMMLVTNPKELKRAVKEGKLGAMIGVEGGHMIEDNFQYLDQLYKRGARYLTLTWNNSTSWASSAHDETLPDTAKGAVAHKGLSPLGKQIVGRMNTLGMMVDVSHIGEQTFWDVMSVTRKPVMASHSCAYALCPVFRNLKDEQIRAIGKNKGVIQLNFFSGFVDSSFMRKVQAFNAAHKAQIDSLVAAKKTDFEIGVWLTRAFPEEAAALRPPLSKLIDHIDHIVKLIGVNGVGLGSDFDGISSAPQGLDDVTSFPLITKALMERGYSKRAIKKILGENFIRVFKQNTKS